MNASKRLFRRPMPVVRQPVALTAAPLADVSSQSWTDRHGASIRASIL